MAKYVIEICGKQSQNLFFAPLRTRVRGRLDSAHVPQMGRPQHLAELFTIEPVIPGQYILVDTDKMEGHIFDPLRETEQGQMIWERAKSIIEKHPTFFGHKTQLKEPEVHKLSLTGEESGNLLKDWLWAMARAVDSGHARLVANSEELPTVKQIAEMPGKRTRDPGNTWTQKADLKKYVDDVPARGKGQPQPT